MDDGGTHYNLKAIREFLRVAFTAKELRRFCQNDLRFKPLLACFGPNYNLDEMIDEIVDFCERYLLWPEFLTEAKKANPRQFPLFEGAIYQEKQEPLVTVDEAMNEIDQLYALREKPYELVAKYFALVAREEREPVWKEPFVRQRLHAVCEKLLLLNVLLGTAYKRFGIEETDYAVRSTRPEYIHDREVPSGDQRKITDGIKDALHTISKKHEGAVKARADKLWFPDPDEYLGWLPPIPKVRPERSGALVNWLDEVGLKFNPFGPERSERDPHLADCRVDAVLDGVKGRWGGVVVAPTGRGRTAAAWFLARDCAEPFQHPRDPGAFPVYYAPSLPIPVGEARRTHLLQASLAMAEVLACYLARNPEGFHCLSPPQKHSVASLLSLLSRSRADLARRLYRVGPKSGTSDDLVDAVTALYLDISAEEVTEHELRDLISDARPAGSECVYLLADVPGIHSRSDLPGIGRALEPLFDLIDPLAASDVYLKVFVPDELLPYLDNLRDAETAYLVWDDGSLRALLENRFRKAGGESITPLCMPPDPSVDQALITAGRGSPRRLMRAGNALLKAHTKQWYSAPGSSGPLLDSQWATLFLAMWGDQNE